MKEDVSSEPGSAGMSSRLPGFYSMPMAERRNTVQRICGLNDKESQDIGQFGALDHQLADTFIENAIGTYSIPLGIATNFRINHRDVLVPMAVEETSVLAAASHGAKLARSGGGFKTVSSAPIMTGQLQVMLAQTTNFDQVLREAKEDLLAYANRGQDRLIARGGGAKDLTWRYIEELSSVIIHLHVHTGDAMGANIVNTMCEKLAVFMPDLFPGCDVGLRILTNLTDRRLARASCRIPAQVFANKQFTGAEVIARIESAWRFAWHDPYRAATHNKGVMNGIDPVLIVTGNDWRAVEAGAHAYVSREGQYRPMTRWVVEDDELSGEIEIPMAVGTVGGVTKLHPTAQAALKLLGSPNANELAEICCAVGLAQNLSALRALAAEGIQHGHMSLHRKNLDLLKQRQALH